MSDHFKQIYYFAIMLVLISFAISIFVLLHFGERYAEQILTFWMFTGAASGVSAVTGISISNMKKPPGNGQPGTTTQEINVTTTTQDKKEGQQDDN